LFRCEFVREQGWIDGLDLGDRFWGETQRVVDRCELRKSLTTDGRDIATRRLCWDGDLVVVQVQLLFKVIYVGLGSVAYTEIIVDKAEHDVVGAMTKEARGDGALRVAALGLRQSVHASPEFQSRRSSFVLVHDDVVDHSH
jgi:hypothetical protein